MHLSAILLPLILSACTPDLKPTSLTGPTMGTTWSLRVIDLPSDLRRVIQSHLDSREAVFSHWRTDSALSQFNSSQSLDWFTVPLELVRAVEAAKGIADQTEGVLDITIAPLVDLWGFGASGQGRTVPSDEQISQARAQCGWRHLQWRHDPPALRKDIPGLRINVAAVAEGLVIDELVSLLRQRGFSNFLLEIGGEVAAIGHAPGGGPWQVGIQVPKGAEGETLQSLPVTDQCLATSGTYRHRFASAGRDFSHLIDPRTGRPVTHRLVSVSVLDESCTRADGFATALLVLGPKRGRAVAQQAGLRVFWIESEAEE